MLADKLFQFLLRADVREIALHTGRPPCALVENTYRRLSQQNLRDEDIIIVLGAARGQEHLAHLADGRSWRFDAPEVGTIVVNAIYDSHGIKASLRLGQAVPAQVRPPPPPTPPTPPKRPSRAPKARDSVTPPKRPSAAPKKRPSVAPRRSRRPPPPTAASDVGIDLPEALPLAPDASDPVISRLTGLSIPAPPVTGARSPGSSQSLPAQAAPRSSDSSPSHPAAMRGGRPPSGGVNLPASAERRPPSGGLSLAPALPHFQGDALDDLLRTALSVRATDLHLVADRPPLLRLAGDLITQGPVMSAILVESLIMPRVPEAKLPELAQTGSCDFSLTHPAYGRFRVNVSKQRTGLKLTARPIGASIPTLEELGMPEAIRKALQHHQGLIVITGPTGHGKTTTMAALVGIINRETSHHVITVEDPIEYVHPFAKAVISQREVGTHTKSFQNALKASLREDPDVIVVGELRDTETVRMALAASETGHLVISTMNTPSAAKTIERLIDLFPPGDQPQVRMTLAGGLRLIISQRLLPTADRKRLCAAAEILPGNTALWSLIRDNRTYQITSLQQRGKSLGIVRLDDSLADLVRSGKTTLEIARDYADAPQHFDALVQGRPQAASPEVPPEDPAERAGAAAKRGLEMGKQVLSRAGKLFGNESK